MCPEHPKTSCNMRLGLVIVSKEMQIEELQYGTNQSTNQPIDRSIDRPTNQSINQLTNQPTNTGQTQSSK